MSHAIEDQIIAVEERLKIAMLHSSVEDLHELLADDLLFTSHLGVVTTKEADIEAHASGAVKIHSLEFTDRRIRLLGNAAVVLVRVKIAGEFMGQAASGTFQFTRVWQDSKAGWQVRVAHSCLVT